MWKSNNNEILQSFCLNQILMIWLDAVYINLCDANFWSDDWLSFSLTFCCCLIWFLLLVWVFFHLSMSLFNWICRYFSASYLTESHTTHVVICLIQCCSAVWHWSKNIAKNWWWWNFAAHESIVLSVLNKKRVCVCSCAVTVWDLCRAFWGRKGLPSKTKHGYCTVVLINSTVPLV